MDLDTIVDDVRRQVNHLGTGILMLSLSAKVMDSVTSCALAFQNAGIFHRQLGTNVAVDPFHRSVFQQPLSS